MSEIRGKSTGKGGQCQDSMSIRMRRKVLPYVTAATYDALGQLAERWTGNNVYQNATYDIRGRLSGQM